jgi:segregation and condensation protein B
VSDEEKVREETEEAGALPRPEGQDAVGAESPEAGGAGEGMSGSELDGGGYRCAVEALLFSSDRPLTARKLAELVGAGDGHTVRQAVRELQKTYEEGGRAFQIEEVAGGYQMFTLPEYHGWVAKLGRVTKEERLSQAALETLSIIAYRQPILRADIEAIRGVQCGPILRALIERGLVKVAGKSEELGRPLLYGTTRKFLEIMGLRGLKDLPQAEEMGMRPAAPAGEHEEDEEAEE